MSKDKRINPVTRQLNVARRKLKTLPLLCKHY